MDDRHPSPPSSKKSSKIGKADLVETPRMSPYRTRSRINSNLTEENIAVHNDSPTTRSATRRVTRRMSQDLQGTENAITLTPVPTVAKRSRRSPSVASDDIGVVTRPKFTLAQENVVLEEDELVDETKPQSQNLLENGSSQVNIIDKDEVSGMEVNGNVTVVAASKVSSESSKNDSKAEETESETALKNVDVTASSNLESVVIGNEQMKMTTEKDNSETSGLAESTKVATPIASELTALVSGPVAPINTDSSQGVEKPKLDISASAPMKPTIDTVLESAENAAKTGQSITSNISDSVTDTDSAVVSNTVITVVENEKVAKSTIAPVNEKSNVTPKTPLNPVPTARPATPSKHRAVSVLEGVICLDTPLKPRSNQTPSKLVLDSKEETTAKNAVTPSNNVSTNMDVPETLTTIAETPSKTTSIDMNVSVLNKENPTKTAVIPIKTVPVDMDVSTLNTGTPKKIAETPSKTLPVDMDVSSPSKGTPNKIAETLSKTTPVDMDVSVLDKGTPTKFAGTTKKIAEITSKTLPVDMEVSIPSTRSPIKIAETLSQTKPVDMDVVNNETSTKISETPSKTVPVDMDVSTLNTGSPKKIAETPSKTVPIDMDVSALVAEIPTETPLKNAPVNMNVSLVNKKTPIKSTKTPTKSVPVDVLVPNQATPSKTDPIGASESNRETSSNIVPLENGNTDANEQYAKFGASVHRKSDGKPIDTFGLNKKVTETTTLTVQKPAKNKSIISINDSSDEDDGGDEDSYQNEFLDNEAMDSNGESSMDEEERKFLEENEIPTDGISLGSDSEVESSESDASSDSFVVSDSSVGLLDGSGDDLEIDNEKSSLNTSKKRPKRGNKIFDTSEDELVMKNVDEKPKKVNLKRRSDTMPRSSEASKRLSLHPNLKLTSDKLGKSKKALNEDSSFEEMETESVENQENEIDASNEADVAKELLSFEAEPKTRKVSKRLSETLPLSKKDIKRMSLHPNTKLNSDELVAVDDGKELVNVKVTTQKRKDDDETKYLKAYEALPQSTSMGDEEINAVLDSISLDSSNTDEIVTTEKVAASLSLSKKDQVIIDDSSEDNVAAELANLDAEPQKTIVSKRLSESMSRSKKDIKRMSLHPDAKLNCDELNSNKNRKKSTPADNEYNAKPTAVYNTNLSNGNDVMNTEQSASEYVSAPSTSAGQHKGGGEFDLDAIQAKCDSILNSASEAKREEKIRNKAELQEEKYLKLKEKKHKKLQEKKDKEARRLEREVLDAQQRQRKREKKLQPKEITEDEKLKAIQKALAFSEKIKAKIEHSTFPVPIGAKQQMPNETKDGKNVTAAAKTNRKRKMLSILDDGPIATKKMKPSQPSQLPAKPEGFIIHSKPIQKPKKLKLRKDKRKVITSIENTSAGIFEVRNVPKKASPFTVTSLDCNPTFKFSNFKEKAILSSNVKRETAAELLARKQRQKTT